jgi:hypothetical protein
MTLVYHLYGHHFVTWSQEEGQLEELIGTSDLRCGNVSVAITCEDEAQQNSHPYTWHCSVLI